VLGAVLLDRPGTLETIAGGGPATLPKGDHMRSRRLLTTALATALALACLTGVAMGNRSLTNEGGRTIESTDRTFTVLEPGGVSIRCELFIMGIMMTEPIRKAAGSIAGNIFTANARNCRDSLGNAATLTPLIESRRPWPMTYQSFAGTLPRITEVLLVWGMQFLIRQEPTPECLFGGAVGIRTTGTTGAEFYVLERFSPLPGNRVPLVRALREEIMRRCPLSVELRASFTGERVRVVMILT
jgi:hypothetical protein